MSAIPRRALRVIALAAALLLFGLLGAWQLGLPGLHYDEAREAGQNAMELLTGAPVMAFRGATVRLFGRDLPLMVQDYIGAANVYLALPFLALTGIGVPNLRALGLLTALAALLLLERTVSEWLAAGDPAPLDARARVPIHAGGLVAVLLAAAAPSFVFWSRQGVFVTNLTQPLVLLCLWQGLRWKRLSVHAGGGRANAAGVALACSAFAGGAALYAKLLAGWVVLPFALLLGLWWLRARWAGRPTGTGPRLTPAHLLGALAAFALPLLPLLAFNLQTGGTIARVGESLGQSYYGVDNRALWANLGVRLPQLRQVLEGSQFWYLGGPFANALAPWLALAAVAGGLWAAWRRMLPPLFLLAMALLLSLFTVSDLFVTHYALLHPLLLGVAGVGAGLLWERAEEQRAARSGLRTGLRAAVALGVALWLALDLAAGLRYHRTLRQTGGLSDHSDAGYDFAYSLRYNGYGAPIALDWGMDATLRYLSEGTVTPIEIFGYASPDAPDSGFAERLAPFLANPNNVYLLRAPGQEVFRGRRALFVEQAAATGGTLVLEEVFAQRDGTPLYEVWRVAP